MSECPSAQYTEWFDFYGQRVTGWMCIDKLRIECARLQDAGSAPSPELLLVHAMHELERLHGEKVTTADALQCQAEEIERLTACLKAANSNHEHFEREWYLRGDEIEALRADAERLDWVERQHLEELSMQLVVDAKHDGEYYVCGDGNKPGYGPTLRAAIDSAMQGAKG